jgi:O-antigen/teichoic acid export membrane protein
MLGLYQMAYRISNTPTTEITLVINRVTFPLFSRLQDDRPRLKDAYLNMIKFVAFIAFPLAGTIIVLAPEFTRLFLGEQWISIIPAVQVLALAGSMRSIIASAVSLLRAVGKPRIETRWQIVRLAVIIMLIYPLTIRYGILGTSITIALSTFISGIGFCAESLRIIRGVVGTFGKLLLLPLVNTAIISLSIFIIKFYLNGSTVYGFILLVLIGMTIFAGINLVFDRFFDYRIITLLNKGIDPFVQNRKKANK